MGVRRNITSPSAASTVARDSYVQGVLGLKGEMQNLTTADLGFGVAPGESHQQLSTWEFFVIWHVWAMETMTPASTQANPRGRNAAHRGPVFLPWHRWFILRLEQELQSIDARVSLPYWNWARPEARDLDAEPWKSFFGGRDNIGGRFDHWSYTRDGTDGGSTRRGWISLPLSSVRSWTPPPVSWLR